MGPLPPALEELRGTMPFARGGLPRHMLVYDRKAIIEELFNWVADGGSLSSFCRRGGYPSVRTIVSWIETDPKVKEEFEEVREIACDVLAGEMLDIADDRNPHDKDDVKHRALRIRTRSDLIERMSIRYGKRVRLSDADGSNLRPTRSEEEITAEIKTIVGIGISRMLAENNRLN